MTPSTTKRASSNAELPRVLCVVGPTSSGKTGLSLKAARAFSGEIINADARQIYQKCNIGTGKPPGRRGTYHGYNSYLVRLPYKYLFEELKIDPKQKPGVMDKDLPEIPHYLMDFLPPENLMTVAEWRRFALKAIRGIVRREHLPIVVGGTGLYLTALIDNFKIPEVPPNPSLRESYEKQPLEKLVHLLLKIDPGANASVDLKNPRRVIRALEICTFTGRPLSEVRRKDPPVIDAFQVGIQYPRKDLKNRIDTSINRMMEEGWPEEVRKLHQAGISWDAPAMTSIGYREMGMYLRGEIMLDEAIRRAKIATYQYAKRQETWFKKDKRIHWARSEKHALELIRTWLDFSPTKKS